MFVRFLFSNATFGLNVCNNFLATVVKVALMFLIVRIKPTGRDTHRQTTIN